MHEVIDLLPGREAAPLAEWLRQYPSVATISRDRATAYQEGATTGLKSGADDYPWMSAKQC
jgi:hypothetical protein